MLKLYATYRPLSLDAPQRGLGDSDADLPGGVSTAATAANLVSNVQDQTGAKPTNKTLNEVSTVAYTVAAIAAAIPGGQVVAAVAGIIGVSAKILSGVFGNGAAIEAQVRALRGSNDDLYDQIRTIDDQTQKVNAALSQLNQVLSANGFATAPLSGNLASDLEAEQALSTSLQKQLAQKGQKLQALIDTYTITMNQVYKAIQLRTLGRNIIFFSLGALALGGVTWYLVRDIENKEK